MESSWDRREPTSSVVASGSGSGVGLIWKVKGCIFFFLFWTQFLVHFQSFDWFWDGFVLIGRKIREKKWSPRGDCGLLCGTSSVSCLSSLAFSYLASLRVCVLSHFYNSICLLRLLMFCFSFVKFICYVCHIFRCFVLVAQLIINKCYLHNHFIQIEQWFWMFGKGNFTRSKIYLNYRFGVNNKCLTYSECYTVHSSEPDRFSIMKT